MGFLLAYQINAAKKGSFKMKKYLLILMLLAIPFNVGAFTLSRDRSTGAVATMILGLSSDVGIQYFKAIDPYGFECYYVDTYFSDPIQFDGTNSFLGSSCNFTIPGYWQFSTYDSSNSLVQTLYYELRTTSYGCTYPFANNYDSSVTVDDQTCTFNSSTTVATSSPDDFVGLVETSIPFATFKFFASFLSWLLIVGIGFTWIKKYILN
jgi:hypothetical protein